MPSARNLFVRITHRVRRWPDLPLDDHGADATHTAPPGECDRITPSAPKPPEPSPRPEPTPRPVGQVWPSPRTWVDAELTTREQVREEWVLWDLAKLTDQLDSPLAAARALFAPEPRKDRP